MRLITRRGMLAAGGTLAAGLTARKPHAEPLRDLASALRPTDPPVPAPDIVFISADGREHHLTEFIGRGMVINLWATWCVPCVAEMPALATLSNALAPEDIAVLPLSSDRGGFGVVQTFYQEHGISGLPVLLDPKGAAARAWDPPRQPTSGEKDNTGHERARRGGWGGGSPPAAAATVRKLAGGP